MIAPDIDSKIIEAAVRVSLDPDLVRAIVITESNGNPWATRFEPAWSYLVTPDRYAALNHITVMTEKVHQSTSWGLMQVMGSVARERAFELELPRLTAPEVGLYYGCEHLAGFVRKYPDKIEYAIAAYNAGTVRINLAGQIVNNEYVQQVLLNMKKG